MNLSKTDKTSIRFLILVCVFAFALRALVLFASSSYRLTDDGDDHFAFGWEMGRVACSLAEGQGFASPLPMPTGPTAMVGPIYPLILASVFKVFGVYSTASAIAIRVVQSIFASLTCIFIYLCGRETLGERVGRFAAIAWAVFPLNIFFTVNKVWETSLTGLLSVALFWSLLKVRDSVSASRWSAVGALLGLAALVNTSLVVFVVPFGISALWKNRGRAVLSAVVGALTCLAVVSPWIVRNHNQFGKFMLRSNFPLEFRVANSELSYGQKVESLHTSNTPALNRLWQEVGEMLFMEEQRVQNARFIATHFNDFVFDTANRIVNYWTGAWIKPIDGSPNIWSVIVPTTLLTLLGFFGIRQMFRWQNDAAPMYAGCLLIYPVIYYITTSQPRFYHAITPLLILSGVSWLVSRFNRNVERVVAISGDRIDREELAPAVASKRR